MKIKTYHIAAEILCFLFVLLFGYTAMNKFLDHRNFQDQLVFATADPVAGRTLAYLIPVCEFIVAGLLCFGRTRVTGLYLFSGMLCCFSAYIIYLLYSDRHLPCTCGGVISQMTWKQHLIFNGGFIVAGIAALIFYTTKPAETDLKSIRTNF